MIDEQTFGCEKCLDTGLILFERQHDRLQAGYRSLHSTPCTECEYGRRERLGGLEMQQRARKRKQAVQNQKLRQKSGFRLVSEPAEDDDEC